MRFSLSSFADGFGLPARAEAWVHTSVGAGTAAFHEHARFLAAHLAFGGAALAVAPILWALDVQTDALVISLFAVLISPLLWAWTLSRVGNLTLATKGSLISLSALLAIFMIVGGGLSAVGLSLLAIVPIEAALRGGQIKLRFAFSCVFAAIAAVAIAQPSLVSRMDASTWGNCAAFIALVYGMTLAVRIKYLRHRSQSNLHDEQERFRLMAQNTNDLITRHDLDGTTLFASPGARPLLGLQASALLTSGFFEQIHLQDRILFLQGLSRAIHDKQESDVQLRVRCKARDQQAWKWVETRMRPFEAHDCKKHSVVAITRDITASKSQENALQRAAERSETAHHAQRRFITTMSHELRTPLNAILGFSDMLKQELFGPLPDKRQAEYVGLIHDSGQHLLQVVNDMLDMSRMEAGRYELSIQTFRADEVVQATIKMLEPMAESGGVSVVYDVDQSLPEMSADKRACQQILINLLSNAIKFTPEGGLVSISAKEHGRSVRFCVKDTGIGMDAEFQSSLGQPFMQADHGRDRAFEGTGLGLTVVKGLIGLHNGEFSVVSSKGQGTTITVSLPIKTPVNKLVPADQNEHLVRLDGLVHSKQTVAAKQSDPSQTHENEGDNRARVSA